MKKPMTKYRLPEKSKTEEHSFSVLGNYMHYGRVKTYSNVTQAQQAAAKLTINGIRVTPSAKWPYTLIQKP